MMSDIMKEKAGTQKKGIHTRQLALVGLMTAVICILGPITMPLPFSPVPVSLANLAIFLSLFVLGMKKGALSYVIYLLLGLVGLPVFSAFTGGPGKLLGPTGGYLIGFLFMAVISGIFIDKWSDNMLVCMLGMMLGTVVCYLFGTVWLSFQGHMSFSTALAAGVLPFVPGDIAKMLIAAIAGRQIRKRLRKAGLEG